jgi:hypothetical protein
MLAGLMALLPISVPDGGMCPHDSRNVRGLIVGEPLEVGSLLSNGHEVELQAVPAFSGLREELNPVIVIRAKELDPQAQGSAFVPVSSS